MGIRVLQLFAIFCIAIGATAFAQERAVPSSRQQVMFSYAPIVKQVAPAVVNVYAKKIVTRRMSPFAGDPFFERFFGSSGLGGVTRQQMESALGSGVIVDPAGLVVTNAHVVKDGQDIMVVLSDGREFSANISLVDEKSDLAVLRVDTNGQSLPYARIESSDSLEVGDIVIAIGNPFGVGQTVTSGIVSALARSSLNINDFNFFIQTDAAINPGNSGGPLVDMNGSVVGINTAIYSRDGGSLGIGFAIPSEMVQTVIAAERNGTPIDGHKSIVRPWVGVTGQTVTADIADSLGLNRPAGVLIKKLHPASPALQAGLKVGDVVTHINGREIRDPAEMKFRLATVPIGEQAQLTLMRQGQSLDIEVEAAPPPDNPPRHETILEGQHPLRGAKVCNINPAVADELGLDEEEGVVVVDLSPTMRTRGAVQPGDRIVSISGDPVENVKDLQQEIKQAQAKGMFSMVIERDGRQTQIVIR